MTLRSPARHDFYVRNNVPLAYRSRSNPFQMTIGNVVEGARLYDLRCAICHGTMGVGDGEAGEKLDVPRPIWVAASANSCTATIFFTGASLKEVHSSAPTCGPSRTI